MKNIGKVSHNLNLAKLVRFQRTNHGWTDGIYDDSLPISRRERAAEDILEVVFANQTVNDIRFTLENFSLTHFVSHYFYKGCGKMAHLKTKNNSRSLFRPSRTIVSRNFYFFSREWQARQTKATPEHNIWLAFSTRVCDLVFGV